MFGAPALARSPRAGSSQRFPRLDTVAHGGPRRVISPTCDVLLVPYIVRPVQVPDVFGKIGGDETWMRICLLLDMPHPRHL
jgi:hypothetical protein